MRKQSRIFLCIAGAWFAAALNLLAFHPPVHARTPDLDVRKAEPAKAPALAPLRAQAAAQLQAVLPDVQVDLEEITQAPKFIHRREGFLSGPKGEGLAISPAIARAVPINDPHRTVKAFLNEYATLFGHGAEILDTTRTTKDFVTAHNGLRTVVWQQELDGIDVFEAVLIGNLTKAGELVNLGSQLVPTPAQAALAGTPNRALLTAQPIISATQALALAASNLEITAEAADFSPVDVSIGAALAQKFTGRPIRGEARLRLVWLPMKRSELRLCWEVDLKEPKRGETFRLMVDAENGAVLLRRLLTVYLTNATYRVYTSDSPSPFSPGHFVPSSAQPSLVSRVLVVTNAASTNASPNGWIDDAVNETRGNNADAHTDRDANDSPDLPRPQGSPFHIFDFPMDTAQSPTNFSNAAVVQLFYWGNFMHDKLWELGFNEAAGNFQTTNFGRGGLGSDAILLDAQDGEGFNNANYTPTRDGTPPRVQMFLFDGPTPDRDGDFDAEIILHEYTHGLSDRLVGGGIGISALQTGGMGEGWSDFYAMSLLSEANDTPGGCYASGGYVTYMLDTFTENYYFGIRRYPYSINLSKNPLTFKDIDSSQASSHPGIPTSSIIGGSASEVHNQGEVWCVTLWEVRANLIEKHGFTAGNQLALRLITDGMKLSPANPNFLQGRDAIIQADQVLTGGENRMELWRAFAKRGMGAYASSPSSSTTTGVIENYDLPDVLVVSPMTGFVANGPVGGPFTPNLQTYSLTNAGTNTLTWTAKTWGYTELSAISGTLSPGGASQVVTARISRITGSLPSGSYNDQIVFLNTNSGITQTRTVLINASQNDFFTELFSTGDNDLDNSTLTLTPDGSVSFYNACRESTTNFLTDPTGSTTLSMGDDTYQLITLAGGARAQLYGTNYSSLYVGANGYLTFLYGDGEYEESLEAHFSLPRAAPLFTDLNPGSRGTVSWKQLTDRAVFTWQNVTEYGVTNQNDFQVEMFFNGVIRMTWLKIDALTGLAGISAGQGIPAGFRESNLSGYGTCQPLLKLAVPAVAQEGVGILTGQGVATIPLAVGTDTQVSLASTDSNKVTVPLTITIPAGQTNAVFDLGIVEDNIADGSHIARITASAVGFRSADAIITVHDNETGTLTVTLPTTATEGDGLLLGQGTITLSQPSSNGLIVYLASQTTNEVTIPAPGLAVIPPGQITGVFNLFIQDDQLLDGPQLATITTHVENWTNSFATMTILDNESTNLTLTLPAQVVEGSGRLTNVGVVSIAGLLPTNLLVTITSLDLTGVASPGVVTITAGQWSNRFDMVIPDDFEIEDPQIVSLVASATGFFSATSSVTVVDNDFPVPPYNPWPPNRSTNQPYNLWLSWVAGTGEQIRNGDFEMGDLTGWTQETSVAEGGWVINDGTFASVSPDAPVPPGAGNYSGLCQQTSSGRHSIYQQIYIAPSVTFATLTWMDCIRNHATSFTSDQQFRVEIRDSANTVLAVVFATQPGDTLLNEWTSRSVDLSAFRGQTVRVAFVEEDTAGFMNVHLDNVSVQLGGSNNTTYDVYFRPNIFPGTNDFLGNTTNLTWAVSNLDRFTPYYWFVQARQSKAVAASEVWSFTTQGSGTRTSYLTTNSTWRYLDDGSDAGTAWRGTNFDDSGWAEGGAQLGFSPDEGDEITYINQYRWDGFPITTFYFRNMFVVTNPALIKDLTLALQRDDGAVVYLNGKEILRSNMPSGFIDYLTTASASVGGAEENAFFTNKIDPTLLVKGDNFLAVEIHQSDTNSSDVSFNLALTGVLLAASNGLPVVAITNPISYATFALGTPVTIQATASDSDGSVTNVQFFSDGALIGQKAVSPYLMLWTNAPVGIHALVARATDNRGGNSWSSPVNVVIARQSNNLVTLIPKGARWKYLDSGVDPGTAWRGTNYDDRTWLSGPAQLGYGDGDEATVVSYGPNINSKYITTYFRITFTNDANLTNVTLNLLRDDGAVIYLNGVEILRSNMPTGTITFSTLASASVGGAAENTYFPSSIAPAVLRQGANLMAVEIHQSSATSTDASFDLELLGLGDSIPSVNMITPANFAVFMGQTNIPLAAEAQDKYGFVQRVEFLRGSTKIGQALTAPYVMTWTNVPLGLHALSAVVWDNLGASNSSTPLNITVRELPLARPLLASNRFVVNWPGGLNDFIVEYATNLNSPITWYPLTNQTMMTNSERSVEIQLRPEPRYFRLKQQ
jgi:hypothetical protein